MDRREGRASVAKCLVGGTCVYRGTACCQDTCYPHVFCKQKRDGPPTRSLFMTDSPLRIRTTNICFVLKAEFYSFLEVGAFLYYRTL